MKLKFMKPKGQRIKSRFHGIEIIEGDDCWWDYKEKKWKHISDIEGKASNYFPCKTVRAFRRHVRKHRGYMGTGRFCLSSLYVGYDVHA